MYQKLCRLSSNQNACFSRSTSHAQRVNMHAVIPKRDSSDGIKLTSGAHVTKVLPERRESYCTGSHLCRQITCYNPAWSSRPTSQQWAQNLNLKHTHLPRNAWTSEDFLNPVLALWLIVNLSSGKPAKLGTLAVSGESKVGQTKENSVLNVNTYLCQAVGVISILYKIFEMHLYLFYRQCFTM